MSLNVVRLVSIGLVYFATAALAEKSYNWKDNLPPVEVFAPVFNKVWAATAEPEPFTSIKGKYRKDLSLWYANLRLPGVTRDCIVSKQGPTTQYICSVVTKPEIEAQTTFDALAKLVARLRTDWTVSQPPPVIMGKTQRTKVVFTVKDQPAGYNDISKLQLETAVTVERMHQDDLSIVSLGIFSGYIPLMIQNRFAGMTNGNSHTALPSPQITSKSTGTSTTFSFTNNAAYPIELVLLGSTMTCQKIAPSETKDVTVPSGKYSIVADFPASSNARSFYGNQDYLASFHYVYKFDTPIDTSGGSTTIDSEIAKIVSQGQYSSLPKISQSKTSGPTTLAITNGTQYSLRILASGPTSGDYTIQPGASQDITISPGSYKIVGTVSASDVRPFYGTESYDSGTKYTYRFYIK